MRGLHAVASVRLSCGGKPIRTSIKDESMNFVKKTSSSATIPVSMLDVTRQNGPLQQELSAAIDEVCRSGAFVHGPACARFEKQMAEYCRVDHAIGCASGSDALLLALMVLGIGEGD